MTEVNDFLEHYGVKGMKWGVRKEESSGPLNVKTSGVVVRADGSMDISPGASLQRLVRSNGKSLPMKDLTYASLNEYDNARYIKIIGGKGFLGGGRDQILSIQATKRIKAPSANEATKIISDLMVNDSTFRRKNTSPLGDEITKRELNQIKNDPTGKTAKSWYEYTNQKLTFSSDFDSDAPYIQKQFSKSFSEKGYNAVRDENDFGSKVSKAPIIIFKPEESLKVVSTTDITDELRKANKKKLKAYKDQGKSWVDTQLYEN